MSTLTLSPTVERILAGASAAGPILPAWCCQRSCSRRQLLLAAMLRCGDGARAGGWSACGLHGLEGFSLRERPWVVVRRGQRVRGVDFTVQRADLDPYDRSTRAGIATVTVQRALIDVASRVEGKRLRVAVDDARRRDLLTLEGLLRRAVGLGRHRGAARLRALFASGLMDQDGEFERLLALALAGVGIYALWGAEVLPGNLPGRLPAGGVNGSRM